MKLGRLALMRSTRMKVADVRSARGHVYIHVICLRFCLDGVRARRAVGQLKTAMRTFQKLSDPPIDLQLKLLLACQLRFIDAAILSHACVRSRMPFP